MPNTIPLPELIAGVLTSRLENITIYNGYAFDVAEVTRPNRFGTNTTYRHLGIIVEQRNGVRNPAIDIPGNPPAIGYDQEYAVRCIVRDRAGGEAHAVNENEMVANAVKALTAASNWHSVNGYALDTKFGDVEPFISDTGEFNGATIPVIVLYRVNENNPFTSRG